MSPKVSFFDWEAWWGKVLTSMHLKNRGFQIANRWPLCCKDDGELNHLLIHYHPVRGLWEGLISITGQPWGCPFLLKDLFLSWPLFLYQEKGEKDMERGAIMSHMRQYGRKGIT